MSVDSKAPYPPPNPVTAGFRGRCPRCGTGQLFQGFLRLSPSCSVCGLNLTFADAADGPAVFVILIVGFIIAGAALLVEVAYSPALWVHLVIWGPLVLLLSLGLLRPLKGVLVAVQYHHRAEQGRISGK